MKLKNKNLLIVGGTSGIGEATAYLSACEGANLIIAGRNEKKGKSVVKNLHSQGHHANFISVDIRDTKSIKRLFKHTFMIFKKLDCAFNCAGIIGNDSVLIGGHFHDSSEENWDNVINTNLKGTWLLMQYELTHMRRKNRGNILNCSSVAGLKAANSQSASYTASKHAILGLTKVAALEYAKTDIRINAICPGVIDTPILDKFHKHLVENYHKNHPGLRIGTPKEVAKVAVFLLSDDASYINGSSIVIDAGGLCDTI